MNFDSINSVNQLLEANAVQPEAPVAHTDETLYQLALEHLGSDGALKLAMALVEQLAIVNLSMNSFLKELEVCFLTLSRE